MTGWRTSVQHCLVPSRMTWNASDSRDGATRVHRSQGPSPSSAELGDSRPESVASICAVAASRGRCILGGSNATLDADDVGGQEVDCLAVEISTGRA
jgi:hypothetical protein